jgi:hypothetical protein
MKINIEFMGSLRRPKHLDRLETLEIPENYTLKELFKFLDYSLTEIRILQAFRKDGSRIIPKDVLKPNESIFLTIPIGGG